MLFADKLEMLREWVIDRLSPENRKLTILVTVGAFLALMLVITGISLLVNKNTAEPELHSAGSAVGRPAIIPPEELFLPDEPDFLPGVILDREQRKEWTAEDAAPFWRDPLRDGEEQWRIYIEKTIDEIMENVP